MTSGRPGRWTITSGVQDPAAVERLLALLPAWFGIPESNAGYLENSRHLPTYLARPASAPATAPVGALLIRRHFPGAAEIDLMLVDPGLHRSGIGRALVHAAEADLSADG